MNESTENYPVGARFFEQKCQSKRGSFGDIKNCTCNNVLCIFIFMNLAFLKLERGADLGRSRLVELQ